MGRDVSTMTRAELLRDARNFLLVCGGAIVIAVATALVSTMLEQRGPVVGAIMGICGITTIFTLVGGLYFLVRGLFRRGDWTPTAKDVAMKGFSAQKERASLEKMIRKELGASCLSIELSNGGVDEAWPKDDRSEWRRFVSSSELVHAQHVLCAHVRTPGREIEIFVEVGRSQHDARARWVGVIVTAPCRTKVGDWGWSPGESSERLSGPAGRELDKTLRSIVCASSRFGANGAQDYIVREDAGFWLQRGESGTNAVLSTLVQERKAGLQWLLGLAGFQAAVEAIEQKGALEGR